MISYPPVLIFLKNHVFIEEEDNPIEKVVIVEEEQDGIGNLEDLPRLFSSIKNIGILKYLLMVETSLKILTKRSHTFYKLVDVHSVTDLINNHAKYCESVR